MFLGDVAVPVVFGVISIIYGMVFRGDLDLVASEDCVLKQEGSLCC